MNDDSYLSGLARIAASLFEVELGEVDETTTAEDLESWDSLGHLQFIMEIEQHFDVRFSSEQIPELTSIAAILATLNDG